MTQSTSHPARERLALEQQRAAEQYEHVTNVLRFRTLISVAFPTWSLFFVLDWIVATWVHPAPIWVFAALRLVFLPVLAWSLLQLRRGPQLSPRMFRLLEFLCFGGCAALISVMCLYCGGLKSTYAFGVGLVSATRSAFVAQHWRRTFGPSFVIYASYLVIVLGGVALSDELRPQVADSQAVASFVQFNFFLLVMLFFNLVASHGLWALGRQVFEARSIGRYKLRKRIGGGGMGEVWSAYHLGLERDVALKILRPGRSSSPVAVERFEREVSATSRLTHPNTIRILDHGVTDDGLWYYAMELLDGETLQALVEREGPLAPERAARLLWQAARALAEAHRHGIIHRDVKPENVMITSAGDETDFVKVIDFGIAKLVADESEAPLTREGMVAGTPTYISPEAILGQTVDARSDVYGLGGALYFALTGHAPFSGTGSKELMVAQVREQPRRPSISLGREVPTEVEGIAMRCLMKRPAERYGSAADVAEALGRTLRSEGLIAASISGSRAGSHGQGLAARASRLEETAEGPMTREGPTTLEPMENEFESEG
jgi:serine/threonine-protein kinase